MIKSQIKLISQFINYQIIIFLAYLLIFLFISIVCFFYLISFNDDFLIKSFITLNNFSTSG